MYVGEVQRREYVQLYLDRFKMASSLCHSRLSRKKSGEAAVTQAKWRPVPVKRDSCLIPNLVGTYLCGAKNWKKVCYRILDCREMGVEVLEVTITWTIRSWRSFTCVRPWSWNVKLCWFFVSLTTTKISKCAVFWIQVTDYELLWGLSRLLETEL